MHPCGMPANALPCTVTAFGASPAAGARPFAPRWRGHCEPAAAMGPGPAVRSGRPSVALALRRPAARLAVCRVGPGAAIRRPAVWGPAVGLAVRRIGPGAAAVLAHAGPVPASAGPVPASAGPVPASAAVLAARGPAALSRPRLHVRLRPASASVQAQAQAQVPRRDHHAGRDHRRRRRGREPRQEPRERLGLGHAVPLGHQRVRRAPGTTGPRSARPSSSRTAAGTSTGWPWPR